MNTKGGLGFEDQSKQSKEKAGNKMIKVIRLPRRKRERERERERETYTHTHTHTRVTYKVPISKHLAQKQIHNILL